MHRVGTLVNAVIGERQCEVLGFGWCRARWPRFPGRGSPHAWHVVSATSSSMTPPPYLNVSTPVSFSVSVFFVSFSISFLSDHFPSDSACFFVLWCGFVAVYVVFNLCVSTQLLLSIFVIWASHNFTFPWSGSSLFCIYTILACCPQ